MSKPYGLNLGMRPGGPYLDVRRPSGVEDAIWDAAREAVTAHWTVYRFRREAAEAWAQALRDDMADDAKAWDK